MRILITGCAGFIGAAVSQTLLAQGHEIIGIDNLNDYYSVALKKARLANLLQQPQFHFYQNSIHEASSFFALFAEFQPEKVVHLAAQAGVRYSLQNPQAYVDSNLCGFVNVLEACRKYPVKHLVFASSSSVYGANAQLPYCTKDSVDHPLNLYAATKKSNELMAHAYSHLFQIPVTGLRYFTVYGPWGRPDMAPFLFTNAISQAKPITVFNYGEHERDFTYISDIVAGTLRVLATPPQATTHPLLEKLNPATSYAPYRIYNIGAGRPVPIMHFIALLEENLGKKAIIEFKPRQDGDVDKTWADVSDLQSNFDYQPQVSLEQGIPPFIEWYREFYLESQSMSLSS
jgi:UDP-glucuronate 4-epimerase